MRGPQPHVEHIRRSSWWQTVTVLSGHLESVVTAYPEHGVSRT